MTPDQKATLDKVAQAAVGLMKAAREAEARNLPILAQWLKDASVGCQAGVDFQKRALGDNLATQTQRVVIDREMNYPEQTEPNPLPVSCGRCGHPTHGPVCSHVGRGKPTCDCDGEKQADVIADTMKRRGLV